MSSDARSGKIQIWIDSQTKRKLKAMAAQNDVSLMEMVQVSAEVYKTLEELGEKQGRTVEEVLREIAESFKDG